MYVAKNTYSEMKVVRTREMNYEQNGNTLGDIQPTKLIEWYSHDQISS